MGLNVSAVPPEAIILNKSLSAWEQYKPYIVAGVVFSALEALLIFFLPQSTREIEPRSRSEKRKVPEYFRRRGRIFDGPRATPAIRLARTLGHGSPMSSAIQVRRARIADPDKRANLWT
jgi:hypothetical protein